MTSGDPLQHIPQPGRWVDLVELGGLDQRVDGGGALAALVRASEGPVAAAKGNATQAVLGAVVVRLETAIVTEPGQGCPPGNGIADRLGEFALDRQAVEGFVSPTEERLDSGPLQVQID